MRTNSDVQSIAIPRDMDTPYLLAFFAIFAGALCQSGEVEFCDAVDAMLTDNSTNPFLPQNCRVFYCTTSGVSFSCHIPTDRIAFDAQFSIELCTNPPRLDFIAFGNGRAGANARLTESAFVPGTVVNAFMTFNVLEDAVRFGVDGEDADGDTVARIEPTLLPYDPSECPANISGTTFLCPAIDRHTASTVHELKPTDIKVIGAIGNSLTAGLLILGTFNEYRGVAFSGGGYSTVDLVTTLPNILKEYRPDLIGFSAELLSRSETSLNVGFSGAVTANIMFQTELLVNRIRNHPDIDFYNDWKVVTVFMGYNDICDYSCTEDGLDLVDQWIDNIDQSLLYMRDNLPRTFVNLITVTRLSIGIEYTEAFPECIPLARGICRCVFNGSLEMSNLVVEHFDERLSALVDSRKYDIFNDFTVVVQPFLRNFQPLRNENGSVDISFITIDCFHLSGPGNRLYATGLWNNLFEPVGSKTTSLVHDLPPNCPAENFPYLYTYLNSARCPPLCTHAFCSAIETRRADCTIPGELSMCRGRCVITSCRACYYSEIVRPVPDTDLTCKTFPGTKCARQWVTQVRRANLMIYDNPRRMRSQEYFKCYPISCPD